MMTSKDKAHAAWRTAERIKLLSDRLVGVGPFGIGMDGVLSWVPVAGTAYSLGAGGLLIVQGISAGASAPTLIRMAAYLALDSAASLPPGVGWLVDTLFPGHLMAAKALQKEIEAHHGRPPEVGERPARVRRRRR